MNYFNPYLYTASPAAMTGSGLSGLFRGLRGLNFSTLLNGTQKTLSIINQAIPVFKQMSPLFKNARTMFRVMSEFNKTDIKESPKTQINTNVQTSNTNNYETPLNFSNGGPTFFL